MIETIAHVLTGLSITASIFYYANIIQNAEKAKQRALVFSRVQSYTMEYAQAYLAVENMEDWTTVPEFQRKYGPKNNPEAFAKFLYIRNVFNMAGLLLKETDVDPNLLYQLYHPGSVITLWEKHLPSIKHTREFFNYHELYSGFEYLYNDAKKRYPDLKKNTLADNLE